MNTINHGVDESLAPWSSVFLTNGFCSATVNNRRFPTVASYNLLEVRQPIEWSQIVIV